MKNYLMLLEYKNFELRPRYHVRQVLWDSFLQVVSVWVNISQIFSRYPYKTLIETKLEMEIALRDRCYPVNLLHIFRTSFHEDTSEWLLLMLA